jgi:alpha-tubulin suppressor-like RCC1 family protein
VSLPGALVAPRALSSATFHGMTRVRSSFAWVSVGLSLVSFGGLAGGCSALREGELSSDAGVDGTVLPDGAIVPTLPDGAPDLDAAKEDGDVPPVDGGGDAASETAGLKVESITVGDNVACVVFEGGILRCWGDYRLAGGGGTSTPKPSPIPIRAEDGGGFLRGVAEVHASYRHACARLLDGTYACWGFNNEYQLGDFTRDSSPSQDRTAFARIVKDALTAGALKGPVQRSGVGRVSAGALYSAAIGDLGRVYTWGYVSGGDNLGLGRGTPPMSEAITPRPVLAALQSPLPEVDQLVNARIVSLGRTHGCALVEPGNVVCWGDNGSGKLGIGNATSVSDGRPRKTLVPDVLPLTRLSVGDTSACAVTGAERVRCWGQNNVGQAGREPVGGTQTDISFDVQIAGGAALAQVADVGVGDGYACALQKPAAGGKVYCWGTGTGSVLGDGSLTARAVAAPVASQLAPTKVDLEGVRLLAVGESSACVVLGDRDVRCWGAGPIGERGRSSSTSTIPRPVDDL